MADAVRDHEPPPDVRVLITPVHVPKRHVAFLDAVAEILAAGFLRLMNMLTKKPPPPFRVFVMADADRLGRSSIDMPVIPRTACEAGIRIFQYLDGKEICVESPQDHLLMSVHAFVAESKRDKAKLRTRDALVARHRRGHVTGGTVYGYRNVPVYGGNRETKVPSGSGRPRSGQCPA